MGCSYSQDFLYYQNRTNSPPSCVFGSDILPDASLASIDVVVTSGGIIPAGTYRVLWGVPPYVAPVASTYYFKKNNIPLPVSPTPTPTSTQTPTLRDC